MLEAVPEKRLLLQGEIPTVLPPITEITIEHHGGETVLTLVNSGFDENAAWEDEFQGTVSGWQLALAALKHYVENYFGEPKRSIHVMRPAEFSYEQILHFFLKARGLARWLTTSGAIGRPGDPCALALPDGQKLTGRVLAVTAREAAVSWSEIRGLLEFKAYKMHGQPGHQLGLRVSGWSLSETRAAALERQLGTAVDRLTATLSKIGSLDMN